MTCSDIMLTLFHHCMGNAGLQANWLFNESQEMIHESIYHVM